MRAAVDDISSPAAAAAAAARRRRDAEVGLAYGLAAYVLWGLIPAYFKLIAHVSPLLVLAHRVVWSFLFLALLVALLGKWRDVAATLRRGRTVLLLSLSTVLLACNWGAFIYAVSTGRVIQSSLGYFMVPLVSVALGVGALGERLRRWQVAGLLAAVAGVAVLTAARGRLPWIALALAFSWGGYGLVRKIAHVTPLVGVFVETILLLPLALLYLAVTPARRAASAEPLARSDYALLLLGGVVTAVPLLWFTAAAKRLRLSTLGFLQYVTPTGQLLLAIFAYGEAFGRANFVGFALIWLALIVYSLDSWRAHAGADDAARG